MKLESGKLNERLNCLSFYSIMYSFNHCFIKFPLPVALFLVKFCSGNVHNDGKILLSRSPWLFPYCPLFRARIQVRSFMSLSGEGALPSSPGHPIVPATKSDVNVGHPKVWHCSASIRCII